MSLPEPRPSATRVGQNALVTAAAAATVRISGLLREVVFAAVFGAGMATDAYNAAFRAAQFFRELLAEGSLANVYVPVFAETSQRDGLQAAFRLANAFLGALLLVLGVVTLAMFGLAEGWVWLVAAGFAEDPEKFALSARLTRILSPFLATVSLASLFMGMLNVRGRFFLPAVAPASFNLAVIVACLLARPFEAWSGQPGILLVAMASVLGGVGQFAVQYPALRREGFRFRPRLERHPALRRLLVFMVPAFIGIMTVQFNLLVESQLASRFGDGPVSWLLYAFRLVQLPNSIVAASVGTAALAGLSTLVATGRRDELSGAVRDAFTLNSFLVFPAAVGLYVLADPLVALMYERGAFTATDTAATASILRMYAIATWGICFHRVLLPSFYAIGQPWFPMKVAVVTMAAKVPVALFLVYTLGLGVVGLPLSHGILVTLEVVLLWWGLARRVGPLPRSLYLDHVRIGVAAGVLAASLLLLRPWAQGVGLVPVVAAGGALYLGTALLLRIEAARRILERFHLRRRPRGLPPTVDPETRATLEDLAGTRLVAATLEGGRLRLLTGDGPVEVTAAGGVLLARRAPGPGAAGGAVVPVAAVMRVGQGPPQVHGLRVGARSFRAEGDRVAEAEAPGPELPLAPPAPRDGSAARG